MVMFESNVYTAVLAEVEPKVNGKSCVTPPKFTL
jgi:hypothetical protein